MFIVLLNPKYTYTCMHAVHYSMIIYSKERKELSFALSAFLTCEKEKRKKKKKRKHTYTLVINRKE